MVSSYGSCRCSKVLRKRLPKTDICLTQFHHFLTRRNLCLTKKISHPSLSTMWFCDRISITILIRFLCAEFSNNIFLTTDILIFLRILAFTTYNTQRFVLMQSQNSNKILAFMNCFKASKKLCWLKIHTC